MKKRKLKIGLSIVIATFALLHFVPVYSKSGYIDHGKNNQAVTCIGYLGNQPHYYRLIKNGFGAFKRDKDNLETKVSSNALCGIEPVTLRLYIL